LKVNKWYTKIRRPNMGPFLNRLQRRRKLRNSQVTFRKSVFEEASIFPKLDSM
jgi:hypothetical protein